MDQGNGLLEPDRYATGIIIVFYADEAAQCSLSLSLLLLVACWSVTSFFSFGGASIMAHKRNKMNQKNNINIIYLEMARRRMEQNVSRFFLCPVVGMLPLLVLLFFTPRVLRAQWERGTTHYGSRHVSRPQIAV